jgi:hypothetical protein
MKIYSKTMLVLLLALTLILTSVIGCSPTAQETGDDVSTPATEDETPADDPADDDTEGPVAADLEPYELTYYMLVNSITPDLDMVMEKVDPIVESEINATRGSGHVRLGYMGRAL